MANPMLVAALLIAAGPGPSADARPGFSCAVDAAVNTSIGEPVPLPPAAFHALADLDRQGSDYVRDEAIDDPDAQALVTHRIDAGSGAYRADAIVTRHDLGEQHAVRMTGSCRLVGG